MINIINYININNIKIRIIFFFSKKNLNFHYIKYWKLHAVDAAKGAYLKIGGHNCHNIL